MTMSVRASAISLLRRHPQRPGLRLCIVGLAVLALAVLPAAPSPVAARPAVTNALHLSVVSARTEPDHPGGAVLQGDVVPSYSYLINVDDVGDPTQPRFPDCSPYFEDPLHPGKPDLTNPNPTYPDNCNWPSIREMPGGAPIYTQGTEADFAGGAGISLAPGQYIVSVQTEGYKIGGGHFTLPLPDPNPVTGANFVVELQPHPLPPATLRVKVFEDISPTNSAFDAPAEHGLPGFKALINEILGQVSVDVFGNPLCTEYDAAGEPLPPPAGKAVDWCLYSDANGDITVPNLGPNRYDLDVTAPTGEGWVQTTTLEGSIGWDTWLQEGATGLDNEFVVAGEPFPWTVAGFVKPTDQINNASVLGGIEGRIVSAAFYVPSYGGLPFYGNQWGLLNGARTTGPVEDAWIALADLQNGDTAVYVARADADGTFAIDNVPDGSYMLSYWDEQLHYIFDWMQVTVAGGEVTDVGTPFLTGWFTWVEGYVFDDRNANGFKDPGEPGIDNYVVTLKQRENTTIDRMTPSATTDMMGYYYFDRAYPLGSWTILEAYSDRYYGTGISYKVENQPEWTTVLGAGVDVGMLPILGHTGRLDWGVRAYDTSGRTGPTNGGIVGTVSYDVTRNELDPRFAAVEPWQPGVPDLTVRVWKPERCGTHAGAPCDSRGRYELAADGAVRKGLLLNEALTESWEQPVDCTPRNADGEPTIQGVMPTSPGKRCIEAPLTGMQFQSDFASLDGNYGFTDGCFGAGGFDPNTGACANGGDPTPLPAGDYVVEVSAPDDAFGRPLYKFTREEDINIFGGDEFTPQIPPPACAGSLHTVDVQGVGTDGYPAVVLPGGVTVPASTPTANPTFADGAGTPYEGTQRPLCNAKLVTVGTGRSIAPTFNVFTDVQIPGKWRGYIIDDLTVSVNPQDVNFGEKAALPSSPIGIYDFTNKNATTVRADPNGVYEVLLPSSWSINCPSPSGVCPGMYYLLGNDPGQPGSPNPDYNPQYRTIGASFEIWPGRILPSDLAPTQIAASILNPASGVAAPAQCTLATDTPQLFAVSSPYSRVQGTPAGPTSITIRGMGFGATPGKVTLDEGYLLPATTWTDTAIVVSVPSSTPQGPHELKVTAASGKRTVNGLTFHVLGNAYNPTLYEVGPGKTYDPASFPPGTFPGAIQSALNAAAQVGGNALVVVFPGPTALWNPDGAYYENLIVNKAVKLQGVGPGGVRPDASQVLGSVVDGAGFLGDTAYAEDWRVFVAGLTWGGNQTIYEGPVVYVLAQDGAFTASYRAAIDGFTVRGGDQQGFPNFLPGAEPGGGGVVTVQGGGVFANAYARYLQITNNVLRSNGGAYGGAVRLGTPHLPGAQNDNQNDFVRIANNRIFANGGTNLAGAIGVFAGSQGYEIAGNDICGNFSAEYGGGISHYGLSPSGKIHDNRVYLNRSYDEGGGIIIAGELPADPGTLSTGAGAVDVYDNLLQANLGNDDGGGLRFLMAGNFPFNVYNNIVVNNVSTHEGGGISINDAPDVRVFNNTIMRNITTATAATSNGFPAPAGLSSARNSALLQATLPAGASVYSRPLVFNNIFWDNRAGQWDGGSLAGIGLAGDPTPINQWDLGIADGSGLLTPNRSILQTTYGTAPGTGNQVGVDPLVVQEYETSASVLPWRGNPNFVDTLIVVLELPVDQMGDYHLQAGSPAVNTGVSGFVGPTVGPGSINVSSPMFDIDLDGRPMGSTFDIGADEWLAPLGPFPLTPVVDNFNRSVGFTTPTMLGPNWDSGSSTAIYRILGNNVQVIGTGGPNRYLPATYGPNQETYFTFRKVVSTASEQAVILKANNVLPSSASATWIEVAYDATVGGVQVRTRDTVNGIVARAVFPAAFVTNDKLGARAQLNGTVTVFKNGTALGSVNLNTGSTPWPRVLTAIGGRIGMWFSRVPNLNPSNDVRIDDFGGGNTP